MSDYIKLGAIILPLIIGIIVFMRGLHEYTNNVTEQENNLKELCLKSDLSKQEIKELCKNVKVKIGELQSSK